jgi:hypothetical protein
MAEITGFGCRNCRHQVAAVLARGKSIADDGAGPRVSFDWPEPQIPFKRAYRARLGDRVPRQTAPTYFFAFPFVSFANSAISSFALSGMSFGTRICTVMY